MVHNLRASNHAVLLFTFALVATAADAAVILVYRMVSVLSYDTMFMVLSAFS